MLADPKKSIPSKLIFGLLGLLFLIIAAASAYYLSTQDQDIRNRASTGELSTSADPDSLQSVTSVAQSDDPSGVVFGRKGPTRGGQDPNLPGMCDWNNSWPLQTSESSGVFYYQVGNRVKMTAGHQDVGNGQVKFCSTITNISGVELKLIGTNSFHCPTKAPEIACNFAAANFGCGQPNDPEAVSAGLRDHDLVLAPNQSYTRCDVFTTGGTCGLIQPDWAFDPAVNGGVNGDGSAGAFGFLYNLGGRCMAANKEISGRVYCADNEGTPNAGTGKVPIIVVDSGANILAQTKTTNQWNSPSNGTYGPLTIIPRTGDQFAVRVARNVRSVAPATDPAFLGAGNALCNNGLTKHEACPFVNMPALQGDFNFVTTVKPTGVAGACVANSNDLTITWNMPTDTAGNLIRNYVLRLNKDDAPAGFNQPSNEWGPAPVSQGGNPNDYYRFVGLDYTWFGSCNPSTRICTVNTQDLNDEVLPVAERKPWAAGTYSIDVTALSNYSLGSGGGLPAADLYEDYVELCTGTKVVDTCSGPAPLSCGAQGCATDANCATGLQCVTATNGQKYCSRPEYVSACQANPSATSCCEAPAQPISCLNKKMYKDAAMTQEVGTTERLTVGQTVYFAITLSVPTGATGQVTVTDVLQNGLEYLSSSEGCTYAASTRTITCTGPATTTRYSVAVRVTAAVGSRVSNTATVVHGSNTTTCAVERPVLVEGPMCVNLTRDVAVPKLGDQVRFTCSATEVTANTRFEFRAFLGTQQLDVNLNPSGNAALSLPLNISQLGTYRVQCRVCTVNGTQRTCEEWQPAPTSTIGTANDTIDTQPGIHIDVNQDTNENTNQNTDSSVNIGTNQDINSIDN